MRKPVSAFFLLIFFYLLLPACYAATPSDFSLNGTTGLMNIPIAEVLPAMRYRLGFRTVFLSDERVGYGFGDEDFIANLGVGKGIEVGVVFLNSKLETAFNIQYLAVREARPWPSIAIGTQNISETGKPEGSTSQTRADRSIYAVATWRMPDYMRDPENPLLKFHVGVGDGRFKGLFGGADFRFLEDWFLVIEHDGYGTSFGLSYAPQKLFPGLRLGSSYVPWGGSSSQVEMQPAVAVFYEDDIIKEEKLAMAEPAPKPAAVPTKEVEITPTAEVEVSPSPEASISEVTPEAEVSQVTPEAKTLSPAIKVKTEAEWYKVRVGIFSKKSSAVSMLNKLRAEGYAPFLVQQAGLWRVQVGAFKDRARAEAVAGALRAKGYVIDIIVSD